METTSLTIAAMVAADFLHVHPVLAWVAVDRIEARGGHLYLSAEALLQLAIVELSAMNCQRGREAGRA